MELEATPTEPEPAHSFVLRSGVRSGHKREFAFALASQAELAPSLGRTRSSSKRPRPSHPDPQGPDPSADAPGDDGAPVLALAVPPPSTNEKEKEREGDLEAPPRRVTRSMDKPVPPPPAAAKPKPTPPLPERRLEVKQELKDDHAPPPGAAALPRRFTRSLLPKPEEPADDNEGREESGTTTASNSSSASPNHKTPNPTTNIRSRMIPSNLRDLLATGLLQGYPVKYIMKKGRRAVLHGVIKRTGILCACALCKGRNVITPFKFEVHAGSSKKRPSDCIFLENGNSLRHILSACANATSDTFKSAIQNALGPTPQLRTSTCGACKSSFRTPRTWKFASFCDPCLDSKAARSSVRSPKSPISSARVLKNSFRGPKITTSSARVSKNSSPGPKTTSAGRLTRKDHGLHKLIFSSGILPVGTDVGYYVGGKRLLDGYITEHGIYCHCCSTVVSPSQFEGHAGCAARRKPYHNMYMSNGVSLHELSVSLSKSRKISNRQSDDLCIICSDGGELLLCDTCPRAFHTECVDLSAIPRGTWCCRYCESRQQRESCLAYNNNAIAAGRVDGVDSIKEIHTRSIRIATTPQTGFGGCALCKLHDYGKRKFGERTVLLCDQCGREYHVGCLKEHKMADLTALPEGAWYCSADCVTICQKLNDLVSRGAESVLAADVELIKKKREEKGLKEDGGLDVRWRILKDKSSEDSKLVLSKAVGIFHESFDPIIQNTTGRDLIPAMVYGRSVRDQDYTGMYCAVLTVGNTLVSAGLFRIMGCETAELPLVATSRDSQGLGYFQALFACIERLLASLKVKHFVLPAADEAVSIWTQKFGFSKITKDELLEFLKGGRTTVFEGTSTLHKLVPEAKC